MTPCLYERLTGDEWGSLSPAIKAVHLQGEILEAAGTFEIAHGPNPLARLINILASMPRPSPAQSLNLIILKKGDCEEWVRRFGSFQLASVQVALPGNILAERHGFLELLFALTVENGGMIYHQQGANLKLGSLRIALPRLLAPRTVARESVGSNGSALISVSVSHLLVGHLITYGGQMAKVNRP